MKDKKLKILFLITGLQSGGAERVMANLSNEFVKNGHKVRIVVMKRAVTDYELDERVEFAGADAVGTNGRKSIIKGFKFYIKEVRGYKPDIIISFLPKTNITAVIGKLLFFKNIPVITCERANPASRKGVVRFLNDKLFVRADGCGFQTKEARDYYNINSKEKTAILKNPISEDFCVDRFNGVRKREIVTAGRLYEQKNHKLLIKAFSRISDKYDDYKLIIYGEGPLKESLEKLSSELGIEKRVVFPGRKNNINKIIYSSYLFVLSSDFEGMPNSLLEAMSLGLPVIATDCPPGGAGEIIDDNVNGILVPVGDDVKMAEAMDKILSDNEFANKLGQNAHKIYKEFESDTVAKDWEDFIYKIYNDFKK